MRPIEPGVRYLLPDFGAGRLGGSSEVALDAPFATVPFFGFFGSRPLRF